MNCPVDHSVLRAAALEVGLSTFECSTCSGSWLRFGDYLSWREHLKSEQPETSPDATGNIEPTASAGVRRCPDCAYLLTRYAVGHGVPFALERCGHCNGIWFDGAEWATLRSRGLHDNLHQIFQPRWQHGVRTAEQERRAQDRLAQHLGADAERVRAFAEWVAAHERRSEILAYIQSRIH